MKIRTWLLLSYLVVMLLPLIAAYGLFAWINSYHQEQNVAEYLDNWLEVQQAEHLLDDPSLYRPSADWRAVDDLASDQFSITLYTNAGFMLYSSNPLKKAPLSFISKNELYEDLNELQRKFSTYRYKKPVFTGNTLTGVYEIEMPRDQWTAGVKQRTWLTAALFTAFFLLLFAGVVLLVNRRLNRPLELLMGQMASYARGEQTGTVITRNDEIGELAGSFDAMKEELETARQKLAAEQQQKEFMIASISHDLKTPLTSIRAYTEALQAGTLSEQEQREYADVIVSKSSYMRQMLDDLLTYTLLQSGSYDMALTIVDGDEFFEMLVSGYEALCAEKEITLHTVADVIGTYEVDAKQMIRVMDNITANAVAHAPAKGQIGICALHANSAAPAWLFDFVLQEMTQPDGMYLIVQNEGKGLAEQQLTHVFDPLFQADPARTKAGERGNGLGLSITKQIMEKHGGTVRMVSVENTGTAVICRLPEWKGETT